MKRNKLISDFRGRPVIQHVVDAVMVAGLPSPLIVVRSASDPVITCLSGYPVRLVVAEDADQGMAHSLSAGIAAVPDTWNAAIICLGDMPLVRSELLDLLASSARKDAIVVPRRDGRSGNPVLWGRRYFPELMDLTGDVGAKALLRRYEKKVQCVEWMDDSIFFDIDREEDLLR